MHKFIMGLSVIGLLAFTACEIDPVVDPNNPSLGGVTSDASPVAMQGLITGLEARHRGYVENAGELFGVLGREAYAFFGSDPRFIADWLGLEVAETYPDFFASGGTYVNPYLAVKQANVIIESANNSSQLSSEDVFGYTGFAKTIKGFQLLWPLMQQYQNGIRVDVEEPLNPGPTLAYDDALAAIRALLLEGFTDLDKAGDDFRFTLSSGFAGFDTPEGMKQINRAVAARVALYQEDYSGALTALEGSFLNLDAATAAEMNVGPSHPYGESPDVNNPLFYNLDAATSTILCVHPSLLEDALPNDLRVATKFAERVVNPITDQSLVNQATGDPIVGRFQDARWATNTSSVPMMRNEELILIYAEAQAREGGDAVSAINTIRNTWNVGNYTGGETTDELIDEILFQRRYSLWLEGHRWVDARRLGRLNEIDSREGGVIFTQISRRVSEISWDEG
jgi:hypothetical protein